MGVKNIWNKIFGTSMDPLKRLPRIVVANILRFVSGTDLLTLSLVNKAWFNFVACSPDCMDKIKIQITDQFLHQKNDISMADVIRFINNGRKYRHITIAGHNRCRKVLALEHKLLLASYKWRSIALINHDFPDEMEFLNFLGFAEPFVKELVLSNVHVRKVIGTSELNYEFPKMKFLRIDNVSNYILKKPFRKVSKLREFSIATESFMPQYDDHSDKIKERATSITKILINNPSITDLELFINQKDFDSMFVNRHFVSQISFKLQTLSIGRFKKTVQERGNIFQIRNFIRFLQVHKNSMREMFVSDCLSTEVLEFIMNETKSLTKLTVQDIGSYEKNSFMKLKPNYSITELHIETKQFIGLIPIILSNLPNLRFFDTGTIDQRIFNTLVEKTPFLESIVVDFFLASTPPRLPVLKNLKHIKITAKSFDNFMDNIGVKAEYTQFETVFLKSAKELIRRWDVNSKCFYRC